MDLWRLIKTLNLLSFGIDEMFLVCLHLLSKRCDQHFLYQQ